MRFLFKLWFFKIMFQRFWYLWIPVFIAVALLFIFRRTVKGWLGEKTVKLYLDELPKDDYVLLNDVMLRTDRGTTQIDHIVVSKYGVFVVETKNYNGKIYGSEKSPQWKNYFRKKEFDFHNPLRQNYGHVKAIEEKLSEFNGIPIIPIVAFANNCELNVTASSHVIHFNRIAEVIKRYKKEVLDTDAVRRIIEILQNADINSYRMKREHVKAIKAMKSAVENATAGSACPKCGGELVMRHGKNGSFIGCSNYPKCRFTKDV